MLLNKITFSSVLFLLINYQDSRQRPTVKRNQTNTDNTAHTHNKHTLTTNIKTYSQLLRNKTHT